MKLRGQGTGDRGSQLRNAECGMRNAFQVRDPKAKVRGLEEIFFHSALRIPHSALRFTLRAFSLPCLLVFLLCLNACGHKTPVRPPEWVAPEAIGDLALDIDSKKNVLVLKWGRPSEYVAGDDMDDLGGFVVLRATQGGQGQASLFTQIATIAVTDRERFRKAKKFTYTDTQLTPGILYRYRVQAVTLDGYSSGMSNTVELVWKETLAETPASTKVPTTTAPAKAPTKSR